MNSEGRVIRMLVLYSPPGGGGRRDVKPALSGVIFAL